MEANVKKEKNTNIRAIFGWVMFIPIALFFLFFIVVNALFPAFAMIFFGFRVMLVSNTGSMEPALRYNDMVFVQNVLISDLEVGDVITFNASFRVNGVIRRMPVTHQIIEVLHYNGERAFRTSGTAEGIAPDKVLVTESGLNGTHYIIGKVTFQSRMIGNFIAYSVSSSGIISIVINITCILIILYLLKDDKKIYKKELKNQFAMELLREDLDREFSTFL